MHEPKENTEFKEEPFDGKAWNKRMIEKKAKSNEYDQNRHNRDKEYNESKRNN